MNWMIEQQNQQHPQCLAEEPSLMQQHICAHVFNVALYTLLLI
jgi:hypothetical protein